MSLGFSKLKHRLPLLVPVFLVMAFFLAHAAGYVTWHFLTRLEYFAYDTRILLTNPDTVDPRIVIVDIDEKSLAEEGHWPWGRDKLAALVDRLFGYYQVIIAGFDVVFPEADDSSGLPILEQLGKEIFGDVEVYLARLEDLRDELDYDRRFADSMRNGPVMLGYYFTRGGAEGVRQTSGVLPEPVFPAGAFEGVDFRPPRAQGYGANLPELYGAAAGSGHFTPTQDEDGIVRRVPLLYEYEGAFYEALSLAMVRFLFGVDKLEAGFFQPLSESSYYTTPEHIVAGPLEVPIDVQSQILVPYRGRQGSFPYVSASDVLRGRIAPEVLRDTIVLVGSSAQGTYDLRSTPVQTAYPGVEVHANIISGVLDRRIKHQPLSVIGIEVTQLFATGILLALLLPGLSPAGALLSALAILAAFVGLNFYFWQGQNLVVPVAPGVFMILVIFLLNMSYGFFVERRGKRQITTLFGQYVPPELVAEMSIDPRSYSQEAKSKELTVLFTDIRGFTTMSEGLSPGDLSQLMSDYLTPMTKVIHEHRGTIDKYMGDAIMAFWGAPLDDPNHARHALTAGLAMLERLNAVRDEFRERGWPEIRIGVGINTGVMSVGDMGSEFRTAYTVLGDAVNLGSRLEGLTKEYGVEIIVSESTRQAVRDYVYRELDVVRVKGKDRPIAIYEPVAPEEETTSEETEELALLAEALHAYRAQNWTGAERLFQCLRQRSPERRLYSLYLERIAHFKKSPPGPGWDGVFTYTHK